MNTPKHPRKTKLLFSRKELSEFAILVEVPSYQAIDLLAEQDVVLENGTGEGYFLMLQGRPINEPVVQHGPFVMNTQVEIQQAIRDYQRTQFGGWPWPRYDMAHGWTRGRFAKYADGEEEVR